MENIEQEILCHLIILDKPGVLPYQIVNQLNEAIEWNKNKGPVVCCCNVEGLEYLIRNEFDVTLYIDIIPTNLDVTIEQVEKIIGEGAKVYVVNPFDTTPFTNEQMDNSIDNMPEKFQQLCISAINREDSLSKI